MALRNKSTRELEEVEASFRRVGHTPPTDAREQANRHEPQPICFARAHDLRDEIFKKVGVLVLVKQMKVKCWLSLMMNGNVGRNLLTGNKRV